MLAPNASHPRFDRTLEFLALLSPTPVNANAIAHDLGLKTTVGMHAIRMDAKRRFGVYVDIQPAEGGRLYSLDPVSFAKAKQASEKYLDLVGE